MQMAVMLEEWCIKTDFSLDEGMNSGREAEERVAGLSLKAAIPGRSEENNNQKNDMVSVHRLSQANSEKYNSEKFL